MYGHIAKISLKCRHCYTMPLIQKLCSEFTHTACLSDFYVYVNKTNLEFQVMGSSRVHGVGADTVSCFRREVVGPYAV